MQFIYAYSLRHFFQALQKSAVCGEEAERIRGADVFIEEEEDESSIDLHL